MYDNAAQLLSILNATSRVCCGRTTKRTATKILLNLHVVSFRDDCRHAKAEYLESADYLARLIVETGALSPYAFNFVKLMINERIARLEREHGVG